MKQFTKPRTTVSRSGAAAVETALALPVLLLLAFGCVDFGRAASAHLIVCNAARTGTDYGATRGVTTYTRDSWEAAIRTTVIEEMLNIATFDESKLFVTIATDEGDYGLDYVSVTVAYNFETLAGWPGLPSNIALEHTVSAQRVR
ncbi:MAG: TadE/TadG family type IV pilus assembly protein [Planctomycetaceae bacterium]